MRIPTVLPFALLLFWVATACAQQDPQVSATVHVPKGSVVVIRVKSIERADAVAKEANETLAALDMDLPTLSAALRDAGVNPAAIDPTQPVYFVETDEKAPEPLVLANPVGTDAPATTRQNVRAELRDGVLLVGKPVQFAAEPRGTPTDTLDGDIVFHIYLGDLVERRRDEIEEGFARAIAGAMAVPAVPAKVRFLVPPLIANAREAVFGVESFAYALTWKDGSAVAEGRIATRPRSSLRAFLKRAGAPGSNPLVGYLPHDALITFDYVGAPDWPSREMQALVDQAFGDGTAACLGAVIDPTVLVTDLLTGRVAGTVQILGMSVGATSIAELKPGVDAAAVLAKIDPDAINAALKKAELPVSLHFEKAFGRHGDTELHRVTLRSQDMRFAMMLGATQTLVAVENGHLYMCMSLTPAEDLKALLDRVRAGRPPEHPHAAAMARLGPKHNLGLTFNVGGLKSLAMLLRLTAPEAAEMVTKLPDALRLSSAFTFADGDVHWRGDWPLQAIAEAAKRFEEPAKKPRARDDDPFK